MLQPEVKPPEKPPGELDRLPPNQLATMQEAIKLVKWKVSILQNLETSVLTKQLETLEGNLETILKQEQTYKANNRGMIAAQGDDCTMVKAKLALLWGESPPMNTSGKPCTQADKEAWLRQQRSANKELRELIFEQNKVLGCIEAFRIDIEATKRKIDSTLAVIRLKTAQIEFLSRSV
jgi:septal ring factor EnvC (AmiA/AmiB activator)